jgi:non-ribosomal peptide synthetase component F
MAYLLPHLLTESAQKLPEKEAVRFQGKALTYGQLEGLTNQVARTLQAAAFAQELYQHLLNGEPTGQSLLATRQHFWQAYHILSSLLYAVYGPSLIQLKQQPTP